MKTKIFRTYWIERWRGSGAKVAFRVGSNVGYTDRKIVGKIVGNILGFTEGSDVGIIDGVIVG